MTRQKLTIAAVAAFALSLESRLGGSARAGQPGASRPARLNRGGAANRQRPPPRARVRPVRPRADRQDPPAVARATRRRERRHTPAAWKTATSVAAAGSPSGQAVPRGSSGASGSTRGTSSSAGSNDNSGGNREPVPAYSRPRDGRNATGTAVERRGSAPGEGQRRRRRCLLSGRNLRSVLLRVWLLRPVLHQPPVYQLLEPVRLRVWPWILRLRSVHVRGRKPVRLRRRLRLGRKRQLRHPAGTEKWVRFASR